MVMTTAKDITLRELKDSILQLNATIQTQLITALQKSLDAANTHEEELYELNVVKYSNRCKSINS